ncbi:M23 family metallopeptidase [Lyngbya confervoides]|uniref:Peptidoglycan DD-metalloendopeptidase family protein n=1 Tax=Lyngbya confervoides BDU141951 TaxID=1574623 RepID=A0ABD4T7E7_9CYAN|nr:M23 family metallopeptidase [Lyngbya confervoides]MCM1984663.1 peptidoglycan DD-metalloendopeptidase family protein [Lyngbya confervoides BDU141951]
MFQNRLQQFKQARLGEILLRKGLITQYQLNQAIEAQRKSPQKLGEVLVATGAISRQQLRGVLREQKVLKWLATAILATGTTASTAPQMLTSTATVNPGTPSSGKQQAIGGGQLADAYGKRPSNQDRLPDFMRVSLTSNPKPTVASPLVGFCHPSNGKGYLSQGNNSITHRGRMAYAYDLAMPIGTPLYAMRDGVVVGVRDRYPDTGGGRSRFSKFNYVMIRHDGDYRSVYMHMQQNFNAVVNLKKGDSVRAGQLIGYSGNSGWSTGPHLHLEVQKPSDTNLFKDTVPFAVSGLCQSPAIASR